ncbi:ras and ef-hand domain-containing protein [Anaeramoeba ignava]|uniref:Ras and ef-hand domain-containing protein n=1 Tax=Anaeramoeba ignava TaxID=1746090 RepID=A0A9Q0L7M2_ANAIG|nr:ras and ef-hand domain-containing protein [Anaeramoeba ignava]
MTNVLEPKTLKVVLLGNSQVGKSCLLHQFCDGKFNRNTISTAGVDFRFSELVVRDQTIKLQIWDTAGQERFRTITSSYYRDADGVMVVYDITNRPSYDQIQYWIKDITSNGPPNIAKMIFANKNDLDTDRKVEKSEGEKLASSLNCSFFEGSAKTGENVGQAFFKLAEQAVDRGFIHEPENDTVKIRKNLTTKQKSKCC